MRSDTTLRNSNYDNEPAFIYHDRPTVLYSGTVAVVNGDFTFSFILPKEIDEDFGKGKIYYYAQDKIVWNLTNDSGQRITEGIYFYRARIKTADRDIYTKANRMVVAD